ncbi:MAG TPA: FeS assembly SUF system protein [Bacteroidales bacterium]|jgi:FeS assembly SUF system protein|nr:FeS assembly SUF system protein [Bacteroidales bacterium]
MSGKPDINEILQLETNVVQVLKTIYDPEIPVNIYDLGLIYDIDINDDKGVDIRMTLTAPNCPMADQIIMEVQEKTAAVDGIAGSNVNLVFDPPWDQNMMTEEAKLELGML